MDIKSLIDIFVETFGKVGQKILIYATLGVLVIPFLNKVYEINKGSFSVFNRQDFLSFNGLPISPDTYFFLILVVCWVILSLLLDKFLFEVPLAIWHFISKFLKMRYKPLNGNWGKEWIRQGGIRVEKIDGSSKFQMVVGLSNSGSLYGDSFWSLPKRWKDFKMTFEWSFPLDRHRTMGIIFRAKDLENYFMIQIRALQQEEHVIRVIPHIRYKGNWEVINLDKDDMVSSIKLESTTEFVKLSLEVKGLNVVIKADGDLLYTWVLPSHTELNYIQHLTSQDDKTSKAVVHKIPFQNIPGYIGFRAYPDEESIVRNLVVEVI